MTATRIELLEVSPEDDEAFAAARAPAEVLYRALSPDARFRFVAVARVDAAADGRYEVAREDGDPAGHGGVVLVNPFAVAAGEDDRFLAGWDRARVVLVGQQGYLGTRLHRAAGPAEFRFVNVARWSSPLMFARALKRPEFQQAAAAMPFASHPALYQVVRYQTSVTP